MGTISSPPGDPDQLLDGCTVRLLSTGPELLADATHHCSSRVTGVSVDPATGYLKITHGAVSKIVTCTPVIDETLAARGIICGASAGLDVTFITFYSTVTHAGVRADSPAVTGDKSNIFVTWLSVP